MISKIIKIFKKVIIAFLLLYGFNLILNSLNIFIPINVSTVVTVSFLGIPGYLTLLGMFFITK